MDSARRLQTIPLYRYTMFRDQNCQQKFKPSSFKKIINSYWFFPSTAPQSTPISSLQDLNNILQTLTRHQLINVLQNSAVASPEILPVILSAAEPTTDLSVSDHGTGRTAASPTNNRQIYVGSLDISTTSENMYDLFSAYGEIEHARVIFNRATGQSRGYGFVAFKNTEGFLAALREPSKRLNGSVVLARACSPDARRRGFEDTWDRTVYIGKVPEDVSSEEIVDFFSEYGEIEEGPRGRYDSRTGVWRSYCFLTYKTVDGAKNALMERKKNSGGRCVLCQDVKGKTKSSRKDPVVNGMQNSWVPAAYDSNKVEYLESWPALGSPAYMVGEKKETELVKEAEIGDKSDDSAEELHPVLYPYCYYYYCAGWVRAA